VSFAGFVYKHHQGLMEQQRERHLMVHGMVHDWRHVEPQQHFQAICRREAYVRQTDGDLATDARGATLYDRLCIGLTVTEK
jgi:hypothetical protein